MKPTTYPIGTEYGVPGSHWAAGRHTGVDYLTPTGTPIVAPRRSRIVFAGRDGGWGPAYGLHVIGESVVNGQPYRWIAAHLSRTNVNAGYQVDPGDLIGLSGQSGNVTGPHLHFEVRHDPYRYGDDVPPDALLAPEPVFPPTPVLDRQINELGEAIAASHPGRVRRLRRQARQALLQARAIIRGRA